MPLSPRRDRQGAAPSASLGSYPRTLPPGEAASAFSPLAAPPRAPPPEPYVVSLSQQSSPPRHGHSTSAAAAIAAYDAARGNALRDCGQQDAALAVRSAAADAADAALSGWERAERELEAAREQIRALERGQQQRLSFSPSRAPSEPPPPAHAVRAPFALQPPPAPEPAAPLVVLPPPRPPPTHGAVPLPPLPSVAAMFAALDEHRQRAGVLAARAAAAEKGEPLQRPEYLRREGELLELFIDHEALSAADSPPRGRGGAAAAATAADAAGSDAGDLTERRGSLRASPKEKKEKKEKRESQPDAAGRSPPSRSLSGAALKPDKAARSKSSEPRRTDRDSKKQ
eukprot:TRINITY_DN2865_c0_g2_i1.p1 TRINITY_DN2865_c0_g2~~TRINITY_DN2865_c0_g2_i1.p1  ORF type:complete len:342 (+),score=96.40 TRINITY_DN2865_c0_g2_i1:73-1098(+)